MAVKFNYSMQSILQYRESIEDEKKLQLAKANMQLREEKKRLQELEEELELSIQRKLEKTKNSVADEIIFSSHVENYDERIKKQKLQVLEAEKEVERARKELESATKDKKMMESLKDKEFERFVFELDSKEAKELDDMATTRFAREEEI